jgi:Tol biopolymer transport system component
MVRPRLLQLALVIAVLLSGAVDPTKTSSLTYSHRSDTAVEDAVEMVGAVVRISVSLFGIQGNDNSYGASISGDGRYIAFVSASNTLVSGDTNNSCDTNYDGTFTDNCPDIFVHDRKTGLITRVSVASDGTQGNGWSRDPSISADGRYVAFASSASNLVNDDTNNSYDVFVHDRQTGQTSRVSTSSSGVQGNKDSWAPSITSDGRLIAFESRASNLVNNDTALCGSGAFNCWDIFVHDRSTGQTTRVSITSNGIQGNGSSHEPSISLDGRYVAFSSSASNFVSNDTNTCIDFSTPETCPDIFVHDRLTAQTTRISISSSGVQGNGSSVEPSISLDGRYVVFYSFADNLVSGDTNGQADVFVRDRQTGQTQRVSVSSSGAQGNNSSFIGPTISADGRYVVFMSFANNLVSGDTNNERDTFVRDRQTNQTIRISTASDGTQSNGSSFSGTFSADGRYIAFDSFASNLVTGDTNNHMDVFVRDLGSALDMWFRPYPDGYSFPNYTDRNFGDFTVTDMRLMFGDSAVCEFPTSGITCIPKLPVSLWNIDINNAMRSGRCIGMAATSLRFFKGIGQPPSFYQSNANTTYDLSLGNARRNIAYFHAEQFAQPVQDYFKVHQPVETPSTTIAQLESAFESNTATVLVLWDRRHAVAPYAVEDKGNGVWRVSVYENNVVTTTVASLYITTTNNTWSYGKYTDNGNPHSLFVVPLSLFNGPQTCLVCSSWPIALRNSASNTILAGQVWLNGQGHLLIIDSQGRRLGYVGNQPINEIPDAFASHNIGGLNSTAEPIYNLPLTDTYKVLLDGQTLTQTTVASVKQFAPGYAIGVDNVTLTPSTLDQLAIDSNETRLSFQPSESKEVRLTLAFDSSASESNQIQINGADVRAGQSITLTANISTSQFIFNNAQNGEGEYDLDVKRANTTSGQWFVHANVPISATDTHYFNYGTWDGLGALTVQVDHASNGTIDETITLDNQVKHVYLPLILRNH